MKLIKDETADAIAEILRRVAGLPEMSNDEKRLMRSYIADLHASEYEFSDYQPRKPRFVKLLVVEYDHAKSTQIDGGDWYEGKVKKFNPEGVSTYAIYVNKDRVSSIEPGSIPRHHGYGQAEWPDEPPTCYVGLESNLGSGRLVMGSIDEVEKMLR